MAISTTTVLAHQFQHIGHAGFQEKYFTDTLTAGTVQIQHGLVRVLSADVSNADGSIGGIGFLDNEDGTITVNGVTTAKIALSVRGY